MTLMEFRRFAVHFAEMVVAMLVGMLALGPLWRLAFPGLSAHTDLQALVMATDMAVAMALWMRVRRHGWPAVAEMSAAMYLPFLVLLVPYWLGAGSGSAVMIGGHVLMLPCMVLAMLRRREEYTHGTHSRAWKFAARVLVGVLALLALPALIGGVHAVKSLSGDYQRPENDTVSAVSEVAYDPAKPTVAVVVGGEGANVGDALAPYEVFAATGAFNVYTVAPERRLVPLSGGLDLVPDLTFADEKTIDVIVVPAMPAAGAPINTPMADWLRRQAAGGATILGVCYGVAVLASAGMLDGKDATTHWLRLDELEQGYPGVTWHRGVRYVEDGKLITTAGVLSGVDGALRVVERMLGEQAARRTAGAVGWPHYSPGAPARIPAAALESDDLIAALNFGFRWDRPATGVLLTDGVGEIELASVFSTYTEPSVVRTISLGVREGTVRSRHGLTFAPRYNLGTAPSLDRLVVPGAEAAQRPDAAAIAGRVRAERGLTVEYLHDRSGFPYDAALRDLARSVDVPTARYRAKALEYATTDLPLTGPGWPWPLALRPIGLALAGLALAAGVHWLMRRRRTRLRHVGHHDVVDVQ